MRDAVVALEEFAAAAPDVVEVDGERADRREQLLEHHGAAADPDVLTDALVPPVTEHERALVATVMSYWSACGNSASSRFADPQSRSTPCPSRMVLPPTSTSRDDAATEDVGRVIETQCLRERPRRERRIGEHGVGLLGMTGQVVEGARDAELGGVGAGDHERVQLRRDLLVGERLTVDVRGEQRGQQARRLLRVGAARGDERVQ